MLSRFLLLTLTLSACGGREPDPSLREGLEGMGGEARGGEVVVADTAPVSESVDAPFPVPEPRDTKPWVPEPKARPGLTAGLGSWTAGRVESARPRAEMATLAAVRVAGHPEYDRVVMEFSGALPGYRVEYVDRPVRRCGSGEAVEVAGEGWLRVHLEPARAHDDAGRATIRQRDLRPALPLLRQATLICDFEGQVEWVLGLAAPNQFRVLELRDPARLVVDVQR